MVAVRLSVRHAPRAAVLARYGPSGSGRAGTRSVGCSPDKPMLLISSSHEKQTAIKQRASRDREFLSNEPHEFEFLSNEELSAIGVASPTPANPHHASAARPGSSALSSLGQGRAARRNGCPSRPARPATVTGNGVINTRRALLPPKLEKKPQSPEHWGPGCGTRRAAPPQPARQPARDSRCQCCTQARNYSDIMIHRGSVTVPNSYLASCSDGVSGPVGRTVIIGLG